MSACVRRRIPRWAIGGLGLVSLAMAAPAEKARVTLVERQGLWWFCDGEGHEFVSLGMNHLTPGYLRFAAGDERLAKQVGGDLSPELARIERDFRDWHFNTLGMHCDRQFTAPLRERYFFVEPVSPVAFIGGAAYGQIRYEDPFADAFADKITRAVTERVTAVKQSPRLLGYAYCDIPPWIVPDLVLKRSPELGVMHPWVRFLRGLPASAPGKQAWIAVLRRRYATSEAARAVYAVRAGDWPEWAATTEWPEAADAKAGAADSEALMAEIAERYYRFHTEAVRAADSQAIVFGDKLNGYRIPDYLFPVLQRYVDVVFVQINGFIDKQRPALEETHRRTGKPILSGDFAFNLEKHPHQTNGIGTKLPTWPEVGEAYREYLRGLMALPYALGWHYCGYVESWDGQTIAPMQQSGFREPDGAERSELTAAASAANAQAETWHRRASKN